MEHKDIKKLLSAHCSGDLSPAEQMRVEEHLADCPACRADLADLETALRLVRTTPKVEPPPWLTSRIMARLREESAPRRKWYELNFFPLRARLPMQAIALLIVCVSGYYLARSLETRMNAPTEQLEMSATAPTATAPAKPAVPQPAPSVTTPDATQLEKREQPAPKQTQPLAPPPEMPKAAERQAPPPSPAVSDKATVPPAFAPAPPVSREERAAPATGTGIESMKSEAPAALYDQPLGAASEMSKPAKKAKKAAGIHDQAGRYGTAPAATMAPQKAAFPQLKVRLAISNVATANEAVRQAVTRSGGEIVQAVGERQFKIRIGKEKLPELLERLERIGRIAERPAVFDSAGMVEMEISW